ncbi:uncharacterized protein PODANS_1_4960 [Podospora anserina S mat+]|uniref:Podospora anserina S mat+ genomic DNA chromosome 1, supercontig 1 n=2 Tax=Podospora TaxID=5144 RepID=B2AAR9_PODAN|nr:uncharacterized protein PODANS_1_4960 [Podospora anserina S mat+]CAP60181.1 unnamed protein product [Podospora anserina S mat+]CDP22821.1 Putative protein of unknown function [Podospora anserina S mat+]
MVPQRPSVGDSFIALGPRLRSWNEHLCPHPPTLQRARFTKMASTKPFIRVRKAELADTDAIVRIHYEAFDDDVMNQLMYPGGATEASRKRFGERVFPRPQSDEELAKNGETILNVAEYFPEGPDGPGEVVAFSKWVLHRNPRTEEQWKSEDYVPTVENFGEGADLSVINAFIGELNRKQRDHAKGEAALFLGILACSPDRQRLGAGSALVKWGTDLADSLRLPTRLESSPVGYAVYRKFGFEDVDVLDMKVKETWGVTKEEGRYWGENNAVALAGPVPEGVMRSVIMRRPVKRRGSAA